MCMAPAGTPGREASGDSSTREWASAAPCFWGWDLPGLTQLVSAAAGTVQSACATDLSPPRRAHLWPPSRYPLPRMLDIWAFWRQGFRTSGRVHWLPGGKGQRALDPRVRPLLRPRGGMRPGTGPTGHRQREGPFLQDCGLTGPHVTALGLPGQGQNQLSLPDAPEVRESRGGHLDGYFGRLVTSEGWWQGARPLLQRSLLSLCGSQ